jgi:hypothetical protein
MVQAEKFLIPILDGEYRLFTHKSQLVLMETGAGLKRGRVPLFARNLP